MNFLPIGFNLFIDKNCNRYQFLCDLLTSYKIPFSPIVLEDKTHIYINFPRTSYNPQFRIKTILVHYDRVEGTPGANDNSAAVFQIIQFIKRLIHSNEVHNIRIFFTDGEELEEEQGVSSQGAFAIATKFKKLGITNDDIFVFDGCGRGDVLVVSTAGNNGVGNIQFKKRFNELYQLAQRIAMTVSPGSWVSLPVPYSDNASFIASGIPALAITVLPAIEATQLMTQLKNDKNLEHSILTNAVRDRNSIKSNSSLPLTWKLMHTPDDTAQTLTPQAFLLMEKYLDALAKSKTLQ